MDSDINLSDMPKRRFGFSILNLLLLTGFIGASLSALNSMRVESVVQQANRALVVENERLRRVHGEMIVEDPSVLCAQAVDDSESDFDNLRWMWVVYVPEGQNYSLKWTKGDQANTTSVPLSAGMQKIALRYCYDSLKGKWFQRLTRTEVGSSGGQYSHVSEFKGIPWMEDNSRGAKIDGIWDPHFGPPIVVVAEEGKPFLLKRYRWIKPPEKNLKWRQGEITDEGFEIWIDRDSKVTLEPAAESN